MNPADDEPASRSQLLTELEALRGRVTALELSLTEADDRFDALTQGVQVGVVVQGPVAEILFINPKAIELLGQTRDQLMGKSSFDASWEIIREDGSLFHGEDRPVATVLKTRQPVRDVLMGIFRPLRGDRVWLLVSAMPQFMPGGQGALKQVVATFTDVTALKNAEDTVRTQSAMIEELSTPLLPISDDVMVMPLVGAVDPSRGARIMATLLPGIAARPTRVVILDLTGVPFLDGRGAFALIQAAQAAKLLGARVMLTGIRPKVAQALVALGADMSSLIIRRTLHRGIAAALHRPVASPPAGVPPSPSTP